MALGRRGVAFDEVEVQEFADFAQQVGRRCWEASGADCDQTAAEIAHEVRNPLGCILMAAEYALNALRRQSGNREMETPLQDILHQAQRANDIIDEMLRSSRREPLVHSPLDLNDIIRCALQFASCDGPDARVEQQLCPDLPLVAGSKVQLQQVFVNLLRNAFQAPGEGRVVRVATGYHGKWVWGIVSDNGPGIPLEHRDLIFEPGFTSRKDQGGLGIGLGICRNIIISHGGHIELQTEERGSEFRVEVPVCGRCGSA